MIDSLQRVILEHAGDTLALKARLNLVFELSRKDSQKAKSYCYQVINQATSMHRIKELQGAYAYLVTLHQNSGRLDSAQYYVTVLEKTSKENPNNVSVALTYYQTTGLFYKNIGQYNQALPFMLKALNLNEGENENHAGQLLNVGNTYFNLGDLKNAARFHLRSLEMFEKTKNKRGQSFCLNSLGNDFFKLNQFDQAATYIHLSVKLKEELQDKRGLISSWTSLGDVYKEKGQFQLSEKYYTQALTASKEMKLLLEEARCYNQLGLLYKKMDDIPQALESFSTALQLSKQGGDSAMITTISSTLVVLKFKAQNEKETESQLLANLETHINLGDRSEEATGYSNLAQYYASTKKFDKAYYYLEKYKKVQDRLSGSSIIIQIKELEAQFEKEKKEKEIALLKKDKELHQLELSRERANVIIIVIVLISVVIIGALLINRYRVTNKAKRILEMERMRNGIARDLHDDIGSTLSSINILSQLALQTNNGESIKYFQRIHEHSGQIMEKMSDIVWSINPTNDSLEQVLVKMKEFAAEILEPKNISYSFEEEEQIKNLALTIEKRKNIFLIFKEAVNNAAKYSDGSLITIRIWVESEKIQLSITDNGKGFDALTVKPGNGLKNMEARAANIFGLLQRISRPGEGTSIKLEVPIT